MEPKRYVFVTEPNEEVGRMHELTWDAESGAYVVGKPVGWKVTEAITDLIDEHQPDEHASYRQGEG